MRFFILERCGQEGGLDGLAGSEGVGPTTRYLAERT